MLVAMLAQPLDRTSGARLDVRLCSAQLPALTGRAGERWFPAIADAGEIAIDLFDGSFASPAAPSGANLTLSASVLAETIPPAMAARWSDAPVTLWAGETAAAMAPVFIGKISRFEREGAAIRISADVGETSLSADVLSARYAGTGGIEGHADIKGTLKPWALGLIENVEPLLIDPDNSVYQFSAYGPVNAITALYERGASFGASAGDHASYAALVAADVPHGRWATCRAQGLIRLGAPQAGVITGDIEGDSTGAVLANRTGTILMRVAAISGVPTAAIDTASLAALDGFAAALPSGGYTGIWISEQTSFIDLARRLALPLNAQACIGLDGRLFVTRLASGAAAFTLDAMGRRQPPVSAMAEVDTLPPFKRTVFGGRRSWRVHSLDEVAFYATPRDRGRYAPAETYRDGDIVDLADGSRWIYNNPLATSGNAPVIGSAYWELMSGGIDIGAIGGVSITRHPAPFPATATPNSLHFDADNVPWIWIGGDLTIGGEPVTIGGETITMPGWVRLRDSGVEAAMAAADAAIDALDDLADDGILTPDEKIRILIPEDARLEGAWTALSAAAATAGVSAAAASAARAAWMTLRDGLNPAWNDIGASTVVDRVSYRAAFVAYSDALDALNRAVLEAMPGAQQVTVAPPAGYTVACTAAGAPKDGALPKVLTPAVTRGGSDVRTSDDVSYAISAPAALDASVNSAAGSADKGRITIGTGWTGPGTIQLTVTVAGIDYGPFPIVIDRALDGAAATGGSGGGAGPAYDYSFTQLSSTAFVPISDELGPLNLAAGQSLKVTASLEYQLTGTGSFMSRTVTAKAQYWDGAAWLDFAGGGVTGSVATWSADQFEGDPGTLDFVATQAGLAAGSYKVRLVASIPSAAQAATIFFNGSSQMIFEVT